MRSDQAFLRSRRVPFEFIDVARAPDKRRELSELGSPTSGVILEDGEDLTVMQGVSVAKLSRWLDELPGAAPRHSFVIR